MNLTDPSLYGVTYPQRELATPFMGPISTPWQSVPRYLPFYPYGMQPFYPFGMQPIFYGPEKLGTPFPTQLPVFGTQLPLYGTQPYPPAPVGYPPTAFNPWMTGGVCNVPFNPAVHGWQKPFWY